MDKNTEIPSAAQECVHKHRRAGKAETAKRRAEVKRLYGRMSAPEIGKRLGVSAEVIRNDAVALGITTRSLRDERAPDRPRGFTAAQKAWAKANRHDPEARMIFAMMAG